MIEEAAVDPAPQLLSVKVLPWNHRLLSLERTIPNRRAKPVRWWCVLLNPALEDCGRRAMSLRLVWVI